MTGELAEALRELTALQRQAVDWEGSPLLVLAGPGSGKTRVLTCRVARIISETPSEKFRILGLTFTNKAANEMRSRVLRFVPGFEDRFFLGTFHSFCTDLLRQHGIHVGVKPDFRIYSQQGDLEEILGEALDMVRKEGVEVEYEPASILLLLSKLKSRLISSDACASYLRDHTLQRWVPRVYWWYDRVLASPEINGLDFDTIIFKAYELLTRFPAVARTIRRTFRCMCIDEFQDTNQAQYALVRAITGEEYRNLFVVADDDQIIYQWNGASHRRLEEFRRDYSPFEIQLPLNFRCPPEVVGLANRLIEHNLTRTPGKKPQEPVKRPSRERVVELIYAQDEFDEVQQVGRRILVSHPKALEDVAVLARNRWLLDKAKEAFDRMEIPCAVVLRKSEFTSTPFVWLHAALVMATGRHDRKTFEAMCGAFGQLVGVTVDPLEILEGVTDINTNLLEPWVRAVEQRTNSALALEAATAVRRHLLRYRDVDAFQKWALDWFARLVAGTQDAEPAGEVFTGYEEEREVWKEIYSNYLLQRGEDGISLESLLQELALVSKETPAKPGTVNLMTIHAAKGKEFPHVFLMGLAEDILPSYQSRRRGDDSPEMEEERRNCYVAVTRAIETLCISVARRYRGWPKQPSRFLREMGFEIEGWS